MKSPFYLSVILIVVSVAYSCQQRPDGVPSVSKMADLLYDYHKAQAMAEVLTDEGDRNGERLILSVLDKYEMNSAMLDSAMIWYNAHPDALKKVYDRLEERYQAENEQMKAKVGNMQMTSIYHEGSDTTNLWIDSPLLLLRSNDLNNLEHFSILADSSFRANDRIILTANIQFIPMERKNENELLMSISIKNKEGKVFSKMERVSSNGMQQLVINQESQSAIKDIRGYFYYLGQEDVRNLCVISEISLIRMHVPISETDSVVGKSDSVSPDTIPVPEAIGDLPDIRELDSDAGERLPIKEHQDSTERVEIIKTPESDQSGPARRRVPIQQGRGKEAMPIRPRRSSPNL